MSRLVLINNIYMRCVRPYLLGPVRLSWPHEDQDDPSDYLKILVTFIMKVYGPVWFHVKIQSSCAEGSKHLWRMIKFSRYLLPDLRAIVDKVIQRNGYYGHSENIPLCRPYVE